MTGEHRSGEGSWAADLHLGPSWRRHVPPRPGRCDGLFQCSLVRGLGKIGKGGPLTQAAHRSHARSWLSMRVRSGRRAMCRRIGTRTMPARSPISSADRAPQGTNL